MLSLYEILKASKTGIAPDMWTALAGMNWSGADSGHKVKELTGIPPLSFTADGTPLLDYLISGNLSQTDTPTPQNPVMPQGTGERTGNMFDEDYTGISPTAIYKPIYVGNENVTLSIDCPLHQSTGVLFILAGNVSSGISTDTNGVWLNHPKTVTPIDGYVTIAFRGYQSTSPVGHHAMLNTGSTAQSYEPYGYKIPISSANTTTPVYLGEVQTTRKIKKYEFTGNETFYASSQTSVYYTTQISADCNKSSTYKTGCIVNAYKIRKQSTAANLLDGEFTTDANGCLWFRNYDCATLADFKTYLQQQYANGTPVTVWYVLATPTTGIVNEPLMKIGDYADTVSMEQAGVQIPTLHGNTVIDVETTLKPSEMYIKYQE